MHFEWEDGPQSSPPQRPSLKTNAKGCPQESLQMREDTQIITTVKKATRAIVGYTSITV